MLQVDIPSLLGMDLLDGEQLCADTKMNHLTRRTRIEGTDGRNIYIEQWVIPMTLSASGHSYVPMDFPRTNRTHMSVEELERGSRGILPPIC